MKSYCVKQKKQTECTEPSGTSVAKNGKYYFWCTCAECGIKKNKICQKQGKLIQPSQGGRILDTAASTGADLFLQHGIPWLGKKAVEMGRYYGPESLRNPKIQKKALNFALDQLSPMIHNVGSQALDELSTKIRPKKIL